MFQKPVPGPKICPIASALVPAFALSVMLGKRFARATPISALAECIFSSAWSTSGLCSTSVDGKLSGRSEGSVRLARVKFAPPASAG